MEHSRLDQPPTETATQTTQRDEVESGQDADCEYFRILDLPDELIVRIVNYSVITSSRDEPLYVGQWHHEQWQPAITRSCRLFRAEGLPSFYKHNYFEVEEIPEIFQWLHAIGRVNASIMQHIRVPWNYPQTLHSCKFDDLLLQVDHLCHEARKAARKAVHGQWSAIKEMRIRMRDGKVILSSEKDLCNPDMLCVNFHLALMPDSEKDAEWTPVLDLWAKYNDAPEEELNELDFWTLE